MLGISKNHTELKLPLLFSIIETPIHPNFSVLYKKHQIEELRFNTTRSAMVHLKKRQPDILVAEFLYAYHNNYSGVHISNLDVLLVSLKKYSPQTKIIVMTKKHEKQHLNKLPQIMPLYSVLTHPVKADKIEKLIQNLTFESTSNLV